MKETYELTIIISSFNQARYITKAIDSALSQKVNFSAKIIIADDCSTRDHSKQIINEYAKKFENIEPVFSNENRGYLTNILRAMERTRTKFFCVLDADDYWTDNGFLQRAYDFLSNHLDYSIYEANISVISEDGKTYYPIVTKKRKPGTYSREMLLSGLSIPITQTTGMVFRNCIFSKGIPQIMKDAVGTLSERSFEGDTSRFIMHLKHGLAYYDNSIVGVYRKTREGIWNSLSESEKMIILARAYFDYYRYYGSHVGYFVNKSYRYLQGFFEEKGKEITGLTREKILLDEYEQMMVNDVYHYCKDNEKVIAKGNNGILNKVKRIKRILLGQ